LLSHEKREEGSSYSDKRRLESKQQGLGEEKKREDILEGVCGPNWRPREEKRRQKSILSE